MAVLRWLCVGLGHGLIVSDPFLRPMNCLSQIKRIGRAYAAPPRVARVYLAYGIQCLGDASELVSQDIGHLLQMQVLLRDVHLDHAPVKEIAWSERAPSIKQLLCKNLSYGLKLIDAFGR